MMSIFSPRSSRMMDLDAHALHADASADAIDIAVAAEHRNLGSFAGFARASFNRDGVVVDFGNFLFEQADNQFGSSARNYERRNSYRRFSTPLITQRTRSPTLKLSTRDCSFLGKRASVLPMSTM